MLGLGVDVLLMLASSLCLLVPLLWQWHVTYMPNATWRRRGVASARGGVSPPLKRSDSESGKGAAQRRSAQAKRGRLGKPLAGARGGLPLADLAVAVAFRGAKRRFGQERGRYETQFRRSW